MFVLRNLLIAIIFCAFALPVFADDGGGDGDDELVCVVSSEYDNVCYAQGTTCKKDIECSNLLHEASFGCDVSGDRCMIRCNYCNTFDCQTEGYPRWNDQWSADNDNVGYEKRDQIGKDVTNMCQEIVVASQYRCAAGYYPDSDYYQYHSENDYATKPTDLKCTACPSWYPNSSQQTAYVNAVSNAGATSIRGCYIQAGTEYGPNKVSLEDDTGEFDVWFDSSCSHE